MNTERMQSIASKRGRVRRGVRLRAARAMDFVSRICACAFSSSLSPVDEDADGQRQSAQRHDVDRVARSHSPTRELVNDKGDADEYRRSRCVGRGGTTSIISPVSRAPIKSLGGHAIDGRPNGGRFVELVADVNVVGAAEGLKLRHRFVDLVHLRSALKPCPSSPRE